MARNFWSLTWGLIFIVIGVCLLLDRLHYLQFDLGEFLHTWWPLILIIVGLSIIFDHRHHGHRRDEHWTDKHGEHHEGT